VIVGTAFGAFGIFALSVILILCYLFLSDSSEPERDERIVAVREDPGTAARNRPTASPQPSRAGGYDPTKLLPKDTQSKEFKRARPKTEGAKPKPKKPETKPQAIPKEKPKPRPDPFIDIKARQNRLGLPPRTIIEGQGIRRREKVNNQFIELTKLYGDHATPCSLKLVGEEFAGGGDYEHVVEPADENGTRIWRVVSKVEKARKDIEVGTFKLESDALWFRWLDPTSPVRLQYCLLDITVDGKTERCALNQVISVSPVRLNVDDMGARQRLEGVRSKDLREDDSLRIEFKLEGVEGARPVGNIRPSYEPGEKTRIQVPNPHIQSGGGNKELDVELVFVMDREQGGLFLETKLFARRACYDPETRLFNEKTEQITEKRLGELGEEAVSFIGKTVTSIEGTGYTQIERWHNLDDDQRREKLRFATLVKYQLTHEHKLISLLTSMKDLERARRTSVYKGQEVRDKIKQDLDNTMKDIRPAEQLLQIAKTRIYESVGEQKAEEEITKLNEKFSLPGHIPHFENLRKVEFYQKAREFAEKNKKWCESMREFVHQLANKARLHYRISLKSGDRTIHVAMTDVFAG